MGFECLARKQALPMQLSQGWAGGVCVCLCSAKGNQISFPEPYLHGNSVARRYWRIQEDGRLWSL